MIKQKIANVNLSNLIIEFQFLSNLKKKWQNKKVLGSNIQYSHFNGTKTAENNQANNTIKQEQCPATEKLPASVFTQ